MRFSGVVLVLSTLLLGACDRTTDQAKKVDLDTENLPWEKVAVSGDTSVTERMIVPGGWLVRTTMNGKLALTFVGDSAHTWMLPRRP